MKPYLVEKIAEGDRFSKPVYLDNQFILSVPELPFSRTLLGMLHEWDFNELYSDGELQKDSLFESIQDNKASYKMVSEDDKKLKEAGIFYDVFQQYVEGLFAQVIEKNKLDYKSVSKKIQEGCRIIREDRRYLLLVQKEHEAQIGQNYLSAHAVKCMIIAIVIGLYLKLSEHKLIDLGTATLLHEIGMIKLAPQVYLNNRNLTDLEQKAILSHPMIGFKMLKEYEFPLEISLAVLEHHERENGSGYPQHKNGNAISLYGKILAVACSYEAVTTYRPHKAAKDGHSGMLDLLKNKGKQYDDTVVRALVHSLSIYPIGLYVLLSNGQKGQVVDVKLEHPRFPLVQILDQSENNGKNKVLETSEGGVTIVRPLSKEEINR